MIYTNNKLKTKYYEADSSIITWQGICPAANNDEYLITGTLTNGFGAIYKYIYIYGN